MATETLHESFDTQEERETNLRKAFEDIENKFPFVKPQIDFIKPRLEFLSLTFEWVDSEHQDKINAIFSYLIDELNRVPEGSSEISDEECLRRLDIIDAQSRELQSTIRNNILNGMKWLEISAPRTLSIVSDEETVIPTEVTQSSESLTVRDRVVSAVTWWAVQPSGEEPVTTTVQSSTDTPIITEENTTLNPSWKENTINSLNWYKVYLNAIRWDYQGSEHIFIDAIIWSIDSTTALINDDNFLALLNRPENQDGTSFSDAFHEKIRILKQIAELHFNNPEMLFSEMRIEWNQWTIAEVLNRLSSSLESVHESTQQALEAARNTQQPALDDGLEREVATEDVETVREWLTPYQRVILDNTGLLPSQLWDVSNTWSQLFELDENGIPTWAADVWSDVLTRDFYWDTAEKFTQLQGLSTVAAMNQLWQGTFWSISNRVEGWLDLNRPLTPEAFERYLEEINHWNLDEQAKQNALLVLQQFAKNLNDIVNGPSGYKQQLQNIENWTDTDTFFMWEDMGSMEEKARAITTLLIMFEWVYNDMQSGWIVPVYIVNALVLWYSVSNLLDLEWVLQFLAVTMFTAPPGWMILVAVLAKKKENNTRNHLARYKPSNDTSFEEWLRNEELSKSEKANIERLHRHNEIIDKLIIHLKSVSTDESRAQIEILKSFKDSHLMLTGEATWKMFLNNRLAWWSWITRRTLTTIYRTQIIGWADAIVRRWLNWLWGRQFDRAILGRLGLAHDSFEKLLSDTSLSSLTQAEAEWFKNNIIDRINNLPIDEPDKVGRRNVLNSYIRSLPKDEPIPERVFLFTVNEISQWRITSVGETKNINIPDTFNDDAVDTARSNFTIVDADQLEFDEKKQKLQWSIEWLPTNYSDIKDELLDELKKIHKPEDLKDFRNKFVNPIKDTISILEKTWFNSDIREAIKTEILSWLRLSDDTAKEWRIKEISDKMPSIEKLLKEAAHERFNDGDLRATIIEELKTMIEWKWEDFTKGITQLSWEITNANTVLKNIGSLEDEFQESFRNAIISWFKAHDDDWQALKDTVEISREISWILRSIDSLDVEEDIKTSIRAELDAIVIEAKLTDFNSVKSWIMNLAELNSMISSDNHNSIPEDTKTRLTTAISWTNVNWSEIQTLKNNTERVLREAAEVRVADAGADRTVMPWVSPTVVEWWEVWGTPTADETTIPVTEAREEIRDRITTADGNLRQAYQNRFDRILFVYETIPPIKSSEQIQELERNMKSFAYDEWNRYLSLEDFNIWLRWIAEIPTEMRLPNNTEIRISRERKLAESYIQRVELEFTIAGKDFNASLFPTSEVTSFNQFESSLRPTLDTNGITNIRTLDTILQDDSITREAFTDARALELEAMIRSWDRVTFSEEINFTQQLIRAIKTWG